MMRQVSSYSGGGGGGAGDVGVDLTSPSAAPAKLDLGAILFSMELLKLQV
jgi:hypothetical protein